MKLGISKNFILTLSHFGGIRLVQVLRRVTRYLLWILFLGTACGVGYLWYASLYQYQWTDEQKKQFRTEYAGQTTFRTERFDHTVEVLQERIRLHQNLPTVKKDVFTGKLF